MRVLNITAQIVTAYVSNNKADAMEVCGLIRDVHYLFSALNGGGPSRQTSADEGTQKKRNEIVTDNYLVCLEDGAKVRVLKRYLRRFGLTPEEYRRKWALPEDYPMTAPAYSRLRRRLAKEIGLGTRAMRERAS